MAKKKIYQAFGAEITIDEAIEAAGVSRGAFYAQLSQLGGSIEVVLKLYDQRYGGVMERLEQIKQDKESEKMSKIEGYSAAAKEETAKEQILNILFDGELETVSAEPETVSAEPETVSDEPVRATAMPLAEEFEAVQPDRQGLKLLNAAIKALDKLDAYADGSNRIKPEEQTAIHDASVQLQYLRVREYVELVDWEAYEEAQ